MAIFNIGNYISLPEGKLREAHERLLKRLQPGNHGEGLPAFSKDPSAMASMWVQWNPPPRMFSDGLILYRIFANLQVQHRVLRTAPWRSHGHWPGLLVDEDAESVFLMTFSSSPWVTLSDNLCWKHLLASWLGNLGGKHIFDISGISSLNKQPTSLRDRTDKTSILVVQKWIHSEVSTYWQIIYWILLMQNSMAHLRLP